MSSNATLHATARHIVTCKVCGTAAVFVGSRYQRNGMFCTCLTNGSSDLAYWFTFDGAKVSTSLKASEVRGTVTETHCGDECKSAKSSRCACQCGGENHGAHLGLRF